MRSMKLGLLALSCAYIYATSASASNAEARPAEFIQTQLVMDIGASERVEAAAILRVLTQEVSSAACHMERGIDPEQSRAQLLESKTKFPLLLNALQHGNAQLNIVGAEERRKTVNKIEDMRAHWAPVRQATLRLLETQTDLDAQRVIRANNEDALAAAFDLTSEIAGQYSHPAELLLSDVMLMDFAGRQALLTQRMAKIACEIWSGNRGDGQMELLSKTMQTYDLTLIALRDGMPTVGIRAAPTPEIDAALTAARQSWSMIQSTLEQVMASDIVNDNSKIMLYTQLNQAMYEMQDIGNLYVAYSKHIYD